MPQLKLISWNVNGIRAVLRKGNLQKIFTSMDPDVLCLQEIKARPEQVQMEFPTHHVYWNPADKPGYSGTAIFSKEPALSIVLNLPEDIAVQYHLQDDYGHTNQEGRVLVVEFETYYVATVYTPNAKADLSRLPMRKNNWDPAFLAYMKRLDAVKPVLFCGDFNVAHTEDDLAQPKQNMKSHGFTPEERSGFDALVSSGFVDTFRLFHTGNGVYSWWSNFGNSRIRNIGWRIDYWMASKSLQHSVRSSEVHTDVIGSDHCPVSIEITL